MSEQSCESPNSEVTQVSTESQPQVGLPPWNTGTAAALLIVVTLSLVLNFTGLNWGLPGRYTWQPDSVSAM